MLGLRPFISFENERARPPCLDSKESFRRSLVPLSSEFGHFSLVLLCRSTESMQLLDWTVGGVLTGVLTGVLIGVFIIVSPNGSGAAFLGVASASEACEPIFRSTRGWRVRLSFRFRSDTVSVVRTGIVRVPFTWPLLVRINFNFLAVGFCPDASSDCPIAAKV